MTAQVDKTRRSERRCDHTDCPQQVLVCDHQSDEIGSAHRPLHLLLLFGSRALADRTKAREQVWGHHHGDVPQRHPVLVLMGNHLPQEDQKGLEPHTHTRTHSCNNGNGASILSLQQQGGGVPLTPVMMSLSDGDVIGC